VAESLSQVDVMKVDIEGSEARVFSRRWGLLQNCRVVVMEIHDPSSRRDLIRSFAEQGFRHRPGERIDFPDVFTRDPADNDADTAVRTAVRATH
jgi:Methyltransferase FkbM domain